MHVIGQPSHQWVSIGWISQHDLLLFIHSCTRKKQTLADINGHFVDSRIDIRITLLSVVTGRKCFKLLLSSLQTNNVEKTKSYIRSGIAKAISGCCNCEFPVAFIRSGIFQCWNAPDEVTYRSVIVGTEDLTATKLLGFLEKWVNSKPVLQVENFGLWLSTKCPVKISSFSDPQCPSFRQPPAGDSTTQCRTTCHACTVRSESPQTWTTTPYLKGSTVNIQLRS